MKRVEFILTDVEYDFIQSYYYVLLTVHLGIILFFYNKFIVSLYMFRALLCSSSGGQNFIMQHLVSSQTVGGRPVHSPLSTCARV